MEYSVEDVWEYISSVRSSLEKSNRNFPDSDNKFIEYLRWVFENNSTTIDSGGVLYRGRIYTAQDKWEKYNNPEQYRNLDYAGYDARESFVNLCSSWSEQGRMNPEGIRCLYAAKNIETCIKELNPGYEELISIANIKVNEDLKIVDLSKSFALSDSEDSFKIHLSVYIQELLTQGGNNKKDYVFPQFIAECCKNLKYDGIAYRSKYCSREDILDNNGINVTIFNYRKCEPIGSRLYEVNKISVESNEL